MPVAKGVTAALALVVVEYVVVDGAADHCTCGATSSTTEQGAHEGTGDAACNQSGRACDCANNCAGFCSADGGSVATGGTSDGSYGAAGFASVVVNDDLGGTAPRAGKG
jgi:hypothetical protein